MHSSPTRLARALRPGYSETFPLATRFSRGPSPIAYFDDGPRTPHALLFIHGLGGNFTHWEHVAPPLARRQRVVGLDLPGCGDSAWPTVPGGRVTQLRGDHLADAVVRLLDELHLESATLVGHSLGGRVAAQVALKWPARVRRLVLIDAAGFQRYPVGAATFARAVPAPLIAKAMEHFALRLLQQVFHAPNARTRRFVAQAEGRPARPTVDEFARFVTALGPELLSEHFLDEVERILQPTLVLWGAEDRLLPIADVPSWVARLPAGRLLTVPACGHMPIIERPDHVVGAIEDFLVEAEPLRAVRWGR